MKLGNITIKKWNPTSLLGIVGYVIIAFINFIIIACIIGAIFGIATAISSSIIPLAVVFVVIGLIAEIINYVVFLGASGYTIKKYVDNRKKSK
jgi:hypothetical protein